MEMKKMWKARKRKDNHAKVTIKLNCTEEEKVKKDIQKMITKWNHSLDGGMSADIKIISK